ncbi:hypothetical protein, partial [Streptomyces sp. NPDC058268]|uniref:hypothetical protein n=1 Tax=Streptomyces sp. NPDC058268 TaxID=3346413 RepID=UPI0036EEC7FB
ARLRPRGVAWGRSRATAGMMGQVSAYALTRRSGHRSVGPLVSSACEPCGAAAHAGRGACQRRESVRQALHDHVHATDVEFEERAVVL